MTWLRSWAGGRALPDLRWRRRRVRFLEDAIQSRRQCLCRLESRNSLQDRQVRADDQDRRQTLNLQLPNQIPVGIGVDLQRYVLGVDAMNNRGIGKRALLHSLAVDTPVGRKLHQHRLSAGSRFVQRTLNVF